MLLNLTSTLVLRFYSFKDHEKRPSITFTKFPWLKINQYFIIIFVDALNAFDPFVTKMHF